MDWGSPYGATGDRGDGHLIDKNPLSSEPGIQKRGFQ
jgi:hypothetical protein